MTRARHPEQLDLLAPQVPGRRTKGEQVVKPPNDYYRCWECRFEIGTLAGIERHCHTEGHHRYEVRVKVSWPDADRDGR